MHDIKIRRSLAGLVAGLAGAALLSGAALAQVQQNTQTRVPSDATSAGKTTSTMNESPTLGRTAQGAMAANGAVSLGQNEVATVLKDAGYDNVKNVQQAGQSWTATASENGKSYSVRVVPSVAIDQNLDKKDVKTVLKKEGFSHVGDVEKATSEGSIGYTANAHENGSTVALSLDTAHHAIVSARKAD